MAQKKYNLPDLPDNSKSGTGERHASSVANGKVRTSLGKKLFRDFILEDPQTVWDSVWEYKIVPGIKEAAMTALDMFLQGSRGGVPKTTRRSDGGSIVRYDKVSDNSSIRNGNTSIASSRDRRSARDFDDIEFASLDKANEVLQGLFNEVLDYDKVTVAYYYELANLAEEAPWTAAKYGWYKDQLEGLKPVAVRGGGYILPLPKPVPL